LIETKNANVNIYFAKKTNLQPLKNYKKKYSRKNVVDSEFTTFDEQDTDFDSMNERMQYSYF